MRQILWGLFKKIVIADNCAPYVNEIFETMINTLPKHSFRCYLFTFQIYGDFSGYSDIAIGCAKLFGFKLMTNFKLPYFSRDIAEFGDVGIFHFPHGLRIIYTYLLAVMCWSIP